MGHRHALTSCSGVGRNLPCQNCSDLPDNVELDDPTLEGDNSNTMKWKWNKQTAKEHAKKNNQNGSLIGTAYVARDVKAIAEAADEDGLIRYAGRFGSFVACYKFLKLCRLLLWHSSRSNNFCCVPGSDWPCLIGR